MIGGLVKPDGFLYAIGYAGLAATVLGGDCAGSCWTRASRKRLRYAHSSAFGRKTDDYADPAVRARQRGGAFPVEL